MDNRSARESARLPEWDPATRQVFTFNAAGAVLRCNEIASNFTQRAVNAVLSIFFNSVKIMVPNRSVEC